MDGRKLAATREHARRSSLAAHKRGYTLYNQGRFLEGTIRSVLLQGYPDLEYFIFDGGSTDNSVEIIEKYSRWLTYWTSEPDAGQSAAINRGLNLSSGLYATWINSDDLLHKNARAC